MAVLLPDKSLALAQSMQQTKEEVVTRLFNTLWSDMVKSICVHRMIDDRCAECGQTTTQLIVRELKHD